MTIAGATQTKALNVFNLLNLGKRGTLSIFGRRGSRGSSRGDR
jgi:hypothetical protein